MSLILDASTTMSWLFRDANTDKAHEIMHRVVETGAIVPSLWRLEVANVLRMAVKRGRIDEGFVVACLQRLDALPIEIDKETDRHAWGATLHLTRVENLTA